MNEVIMIAGMMLVTFAPRYGVMALLGRMEMPKPLFRALRYVPPAVLSAIIVPSMLLDAQGQVALRLDNSYLVAGVVSAVIAWRSRNLLLTIVLGMAFFLIWRAVVAA
ncbi:MAG: AzlD domain-containing protein [Anaerolineae bacterium]|nr:AzlD domain-containing protein [Anaerolineae bacterium]